LVRLKVLQVSKLQGSDECLLVLGEQDGDRLLPITIGEFEARAIVRAANHIPQPRPSTHDLLATVVSRLRARLERVVIHDLRDETFFCQLELVGDRGLLEVDCRTSDAVALALRLDSPIYATQEVLDKAAVLPRHNLSSSGAEREGGPEEEGRGR
jgi:bifunctional DNase/RNase